MTFLLILVVAGNGLETQQEDEPKRMFTLCYAPQNRDATRWRCPLETQCLDFTFRHRLHFSVAVHTIFSETISIFLFRYFHTSLTPTYAPSSIRHDQQ